MLLLKVSLSKLSDIKISQFPISFDKVNKQ